MDALSVVLAFKLALTVCVWSVPLLLFPTRWLEKLGFTVPEPQLFMRLLGMAYAALAVGYAFGLHASCKGFYPMETVWIGIISNGGACLVLCFFAARGAWSQWGLIARLVLWGSLFATGAITAALIVAGVLRS